ncbi:hypothetical protein CHS0354_011785 [Potamilus streckersoni]|uniref:Uncharacterized protein n=1 Tax=Potamilus streckersoni TaxID=2493646 RepID=A0AAE0THX1_9BIVA|nr:hypothetical protein CHS0354_011785 [Potamilus streckersoni]
MAVIPAVVTAPTATVTKRGVKTEVDVSENLKIHRDRKVPATVIIGSGAFLEFYDVMMDFRFDLRYIFFKILY